MLGMLVLHNCSPHLLKVSLFDEDDTNHISDLTCGTRVLLTRGDGEAPEASERRRRTGRTYQPQHYRIPGRVAMALLTQSVHEVNKTYTNLTQLPSSRLHHEIAS